KIAVAGLILFTLGIPAALGADQMPAVTITPLLSTKTTASGQPIDVPVHPEVVVSRYEIAPNASLPMHEHPYPRYAYVLSGTLEITVVGGKPATLSPKSSVSGIPPATAATRQSDCSSSTRLSPAIPILFSVPKKPHAAHPPSAEVSV
ncbi:MAG: cupin domain-containing protein, partial [Candidatus Binataceae bacterium]